MKRFALALALALFALPTVALADGAYRFELTPHVSYHFGGSLDGEGNFAEADELELEDDAAIGVTFDIPLSNNLQLELLYNYQETDLFADAGIFGPDIELLETEIAYAHVGLLAQFGRASVTPYFVISAGMTRIDASHGSGSGADNLFSVSAGAGLKLFLTPFLGVRLEGRGFWTKVDNLEVGNQFDAHDYLSQGQATLGVIIAF